MSLKPYRSGKGKVKQSVVRVKAIICTRKFASQASSEQEWKNRIGVKSHTSMEAGGGYVE